MPQELQEGDDCVLANDQHKPPKIYKLTTKDPGGKCTITDKDGNTSPHHFSELRPAPPAKTP